MTSQGVIIAAVLVAVIPTLYVLWNLVWYGTIRGYDIDPDKERD